MSNHFNVKKGDTAPAITATLLDATGTAVNLTGATVKFIMSRRGSDIPKVNAAASIVDPTTGTVRYQWQSTDTDTHGVYLAEWECVFADGSTQTFPNSRHLDIHVVPDLA